MRPVSASENLELLAVDKNFLSRVEGGIKSLRKRPKKILQFGQCRISSAEYADFLADSIEGIEEKQTLKEKLAEEFKWYEIFGKDEWGEILLTSYYSPVIEGRKKAEGEYRYPLFSIPSDLVEVEMKKFELKDLIVSKSDEGSSVRTKVPARIIEGWNGISRITPYYSRLEIDEDFSLVSNKAKVLAYVKPVEAFFFHIQGSGVIRFKSGKLVSLGYAAQNGHRYFSIGKLLYDKIPKEEMTKAKIEDYLRDLSPKELQEFLGKNPSYVFFKKLKKGLGRTTFGPEVIEKGTIAIDPRVVSLGSLAFLEFDSPKFNNLQQSSPGSFSREARLVWAHDTGGAIKGAGRADLYWGSGRKAGQAAGVINQRAKLWVLGPKVCRKSN